MLRLLAIVLAALLHQSPAHAGLGTATTATFHGSHGTVCVVDVRCRPARR